MFPCRDGNHHQHDRPCVRASMGSGVGDFCLGAVVDG
jgi:hypothetical protein